MQPNNEEFAFFKTLEGDRPELEWFRNTILLSGLDKEDNATIIYNYEILEKKIFPQYRRYEKKPAAKGDHSNYTWFNILGDSDKTLMQFANHYSMAHYLEYLKNGGEPFSQYAKRSGILDVPQKYSAGTTWEDARGQKSEIIGYTFPNYILRRSWPEVTGKAPLNAYASEAEVNKDLETFKTMGAMWRKEREAREQREKDKKAANETKQKEERHLNNFLHTAKNNMTAGKWRKILTEKIVSFKETGVGPRYKCVEGFLKAGWKLKMDAYAEGKFILERSDGAYYEQDDYLPLTAMLYAKHLQTDPAFQAEMQADVKDSGPKPEEVPNAQTAEGESLQSLPQKEAEFVQEVAFRLHAQKAEAESQEYSRADAGNEKISRTWAEKTAREQYGIADISVVKELTELAIVVAAKKELHNIQSGEKQAFDAVCKLYELQPNISLRTSESVMLQQYSTPVNIGYLVGYWCGLWANRNNENFSYFEPSAGNGMLTVADTSSNGTGISVSPKAVVNEIDPRRRKSLRALGFKTILEQDATKPFIGYEKKFDAVLTNPPFGKADNADNVFDGYTIKGLEHLMAVRALECMKDNGRAAIIVGGHTAWDDRGRVQAGKNRIFLNYLYAHYNVADVINIDGKKLYSRQGTGFNVRLILIAGRKQKPEGFAPLRALVNDTTETDFKNLFNRVRDAQENSGTSAESVENLALAQAQFDFDADAMQMEIELMEAEGDGLGDASREHANRPIFRMAMEWAEMKLLPITIYNKHLNKEIHFNSKGLKKAIEAGGWSYVERAKMIYSIPNFLPNAIPVGEAQIDNRGRKEILSVQKMLAIWKNEDGLEIEIYIVLRQLHDGHYYYDHGIATRKKLSSD